MALAYETNTSLAFDTDVLRQYGERYETVASKLRTLSNELDACLTELKDNGWTTPAGTAFQKMVDTNWEKNIEKYASLLEMLNQILKSASDQYDSLVQNYIEKTKL